MKTNNKKRWKTDTTHVPIMAQVGFAAVFILLTYLANILLHANTDFRPSLAVGGSQLAALYGYCYLIRLSFDPQKRSMAGRLLLLFTTVLPALAALLFFVVYPLGGVVLKEDGLAFDLGEFAAKTFLALKTVWLCAAIYFWFYRRELAQRRVLALERAASGQRLELQEVKSSLLLSANESHYFRHILADLAARAENTGDGYTAKQLIHLGNTLRFVADAVSQATPVLSIHTALSYFDDVVESIRLKHGNDAIIDISITGEPTVQKIGALVLPTLLENADTHGRVDIGHPIRITFTFGRGYFQFTCTNAKRQDGHRARNSGQGLGLVKQQLALQSRDVVNLEQLEDESTYTVSLTINYR